MSITEPNDAIARAEDLAEDGRWEESIALLRRVGGDAADGAARTRLQLKLLDVLNNDDWARGHHNHADKLKLISEVGSRLGDDPSPELAELRYQEGVALHIDFVLGSGAPTHELDCFTRAAELFSQCGDAEGEALATSFVGIYHHVDRLDRATAEPILRKAYDLAPKSGSHARSEAARHLGQILQETGRPAEAIPYLEESRDQHAQAGHPRRLASALHALAYAQFEAGDTESARVNLTRARYLAERYGSKPFEAMIARTEADMNFEALSSPAMRRRTHP